MRKNHDEVEFVTGKRIYAYVALAGSLLRVIRDAYDMHERGEAFYVRAPMFAEVQRKAGCLPPERTNEATANAAQGVFAAATSNTAAEAPGGERSTKAMPIAQGRVGDVPGPVVVREPSPSRTEGQRPLGDAYGGMSGGTLPQDHRNMPVGHAGAPARAMLPSTRTAPPQSHRPTHPSSAPATEPPDSSHGFWPTRALGAPSNPVIVDDAMRSLAVSDDVTDADFGKVGREVSMAERLPKAPARVKAKDTKTPKTVLVVDDESDIRRLARRALEEHRYAIMEATCGHEALDALKQHSLDLVVVDAMLPDIHGFDIAKRMKGAERYGHIPIIMISAAHRGWRFADVKASYGVHAYIEKPLKIVDLVEAVRAAIEQRVPASNVEAISTDAEKMLTMGIEAYQRGQLDQAVIHLREGTRIDPLAYRLHFHLGLLSGKQAKVFDAIQELKLRWRSMADTSQLSRVCRPLPEGRLPQQGDRNVGTCPRRGTGRRNPPVHQGAPTWTSLTSAPGAPARRVVSGVALREALMTLVRTSSRQFGSAPVVYDGHTCMIRASADEVSLRRVRCQVPNRGRQDRRQVGPHELSPLRSHHQSCRGRGRQRAGGGVGERCRGVDHDGSCGAFCGARGRGAPWH